MLATALTNQYGSRNDLDIEKVLEDFDGYIRSLAEKKAPRAFVPTEILDLEIDEIVQNTRMKLWQALQRREIINPGAYVRCIVQSECVNIVRRHKHLLPLPVNEEGELWQGKVLVTPGQGMQDPAYELASLEALTDWMREIVDEVLALPRRQRQAMLCVLKDLAVDIAPLSKVLIEHGIDIETIDWPNERDELQSFRASLSVARGKLRAWRATYKLLERAS